MARSNGDASSIMGIKVSKIDPSNWEWLVYNSTTEQYEPWAAWWASPLTTKGDLFWFSTVDAKLPVGTNWQTIIADSGESLGVKWGNPPWGGDMVSSTYDPDGIWWSAFEMDNMVEWSTTKILTDTERTKLNWIETWATADQTGAEIKTAYEAESDTNAFTDAEKTKIWHLTVTQGVDLDQMETDIAALANWMVYKDDWDASSGVFPWWWSAQVGWFYNVSVAWTVDSVSFEIGDSVIAKVDDASTSTYSSNWVKKDQTDAVQSVAGKTWAVTLLEADITDLWTYADLATANTRTATQTFWPKIIVDPSDRLWFDIYCRNVAGIAVPLLQAAATGVTAFDLMPKGNPTPSSHGYAWIDVCDADIADNNDPVNCWYIGAKSTHIEFGARAFNGATVKDVKFSHNWVILRESDWSEVLFKKPINVDSWEVAQTLINLGLNRDARNAEGLGTNDQTGTTYTLVIWDAWKVVTMTNASASTLTVPPNSSVAFAVGTIINLEQLGAWQVTVAAWAGVTINSKDNNTKITWVYSGAYLRKTATNVWILIGDLSA